MNEEARRLIESIGAELSEEQQDLVVAGVIDEALKRATQIQDLIQYGTSLPPDGITVYAFAILAGRYLRLYSEATDAPFTREEQLVSVERAMRAAWDAAQDGEP